MSLLKKASIITTPTAYAEDYLYSIKPAYALGENLVINGDFLTNTVTGWNDWSNLTRPENTSQNGGYGILNATGGTCDARQDITVVAGFKYKITATMYEDASGNSRLYISDGANYSYAFGQFEATTTETTFNKVVQPTQTKIRLYAYNTSGVGYFKNIKIELQTDADFQFDRNSTGTRLNEDYLIEDVPYNLVSYSQDFNNSVWNKLTNTTVTANQIVSPDGRQNADEFSATSTSTSLIAVQDSFLVSLNVDYVISFFAKKGSVRYVQLFNGSGQVTGNPRTNFDLQDGNIAIQDGGHTSSIEDFGNGWYRCTTKVTTLSTTLQVYISGVSTATASRSATSSWTAGDNFYVWGAQLVKGDQPKDYLKTTDRLDIPRIDYTNGEPSILLEPSRQNVIPYSQDFSNAAWTKNEVTVIANSIISPEGITNANLIKESSANALHYLGDAISVTSGTSYSISVYAKKKERSVFQWTLSTNFLNASFANYDLDKGVVSATGGAVTAQIIAMPNDWYRCVIIFTATSTNSGTPLLSLQNSPTASRGAAYQGDGSSGLYLYGAQVEAGSYATSLIHTSGSAVTRSADAANNAGNSDLINSTEGVLYCEINSLTQTLGSSDEAISISDGTLDNRIQVYHKKNLSNTIAYGIESGNAIQFFVSVAIADISLPHKVAIKYKANDCALWIDGNEVDTQTSVSMPSGLNELQFASGNGASQFYGNTKSVMVFKEALTDLELAKLTGYNNHELYMNYYNRLSYLGLVEEYNVESDINNYIL